MKDREPFAEAILSMQIGVILHPWFHARHDSAPSISTGSKDVQKLDTIVAQVQRAEIAARFVRRQRHGHQVSDHVPVAEVESSIEVRSRTILMTGEEERWSRVKDSSSIQNFTPSILTY